MSAVVNGTQELASLVLHEIAKLDDAKILFECKKLRCYLTHKGTQKHIKICVALNNLGLPITIPLVSSIANQSSIVVSRVLHTLGDKNVLILKRHASGCNAIVWIVNPWFLEKVL